MCVQISEEKVFQGTKKYIQDTDKTPVPMKVAVVAFVRLKKQVKETA